MSTIDYYNENAKHYFDTTINADMSKIYDMFLKYVRKGGKILDFGCGSGRDTFNFKNLGYDVDAIDGSAELCKLAREYTGVDVKCMNFNDFRTDSVYDGIWACASLLHLNRTELINVMKNLRDALKLHAVLYAGFKHGEGEEVTKEGRYFLYHTEDDILDLTDGLGLKKIAFSSNKSTSNPNETKYFDNYIFERKL